MIRTVKSIHSRRADEHPLTPRTVAITSALYCPAGLAIGAMVQATRMGLRALWLAGGALLGVVVVKLFFFDLAALAGLERIVAFLGVGLMLLAIGYFSPVPPRQADDVPATSVG